MNFQKIDAHQHFWKFDPVRDSWISEEMKLIRKDFFPSDLAPLLRQEGFAGCVAVQASQSEEENDFLLDLAAKHDFIKGVVGWVDLRAENIQERLAYYRQFPKLKGFRHVLQGEPQRDLMLSPEFVRGIAALQAFDFTYDILIFPDQLVYSRDLAARFPGQPFVLDHIAKPYIRKKEINDWAADIKALAKHPNVWCKVSGMVTEADWQGWKKEDFKPFIDVIVESFGTNRLMFGSDWPVCQVAASYADVVGIVADYFASFPQDQQANVFGLNASQFYHL